MVRRTSWALVLLFSAISLFGQQTIYWKKDHLYNGPGGKEIAVAVPAPSDSTVPSAPTGVGYSSVTASSVQISWSASTDSGGSGLAGYKVYRQLGSGASLPVGTVGTGTLSFTDQPLVPSTSYTYKVVAFDNAQNHSAGSSTVSFTTSAASTDSTAPSAPTGLTAYLPVRNTVRLSWNRTTDTGGSGLAGYKVYRGGTLISGNNPITAATFDDAGLSYKTTYSYTVTAVDGANNTATSSALNVTTDRQLLFQDAFSRADQSGLSNGWSSTAFNVAAFQASCPAPAPYADYWCNATLSGQPATFKATVTVIQQSGSSSYGTGLVLYAGTGGYRAVRRYVGYPYGYMICLDRYSNLNASQTPTSSTCGSNWTFGSTGTLSVETNSTTGSVKVYGDGILQVDTTISTSDMTGGVGITGSAWWSPGNPAILDNFVLESN